MIPKSTLQELYDSEINFQISTFWDSGFDWKLGDNLNGFVDGGNEDSFNEAIESLVNAAVRHFPKSKFAIEFRKQ